MPGTGLFAPSGAAVMVALNDEAKNALLAKGTAANLPSAVAGYAIGCTYIATDTGAQYTNIGTAASCSFIQGVNAVDVLTTQVTLTPAQIIVGTSIPLIAAPGAGKYINLISATISYTYNTAAYTGGGATSIALGTTVLTGTIAAASSLGKASSNIIQLVPLATAGNDLTGLTATALNINVATGAYTNPGTAAGTAKVTIAYQILTA
jgi:hypothetical protein